ECDVCCDSRGVCIAGARPSTRYCCSHVGRCYLIDQPFARHSCRSARVLKDIDVAFAVKCQTDDGLEPGADRHERLICRCAEYESIYRGFLVKERRARELPDVVRTVRCNFYPGPHLVPAI